MILTDGDSMSTFLDRAQSIAATAAKIAHLQGASVEATVLSVARPSLLETGFDSYDGSNGLHTLMLQVPITTYALLDDVEEIEKSIQRRVSRIVRQDLGNLITEVIISPELAGDLGDAATATSAGAQEEVPSFWQPGYFRLFITHLAGDKAKAHKLKEALAIYQVAAFVAHDDIEPTREWQPEIERALRTMDALVAILSPRFIESKWCDQEVGMAIGRGKLVLPVRAGADPHGFMGKYQALQAVSTGDASTLAAKIVDILIQHSMSSDRMTEALVDRFVASGSFEASKRTMSLLEKAPRMNSAQVARLVRSIDENIDIREAWGVPQRVRDLVSKVGGPTV